MTSRINIIGCGRAAGSLARLWLQAGSVTIGDVLNRQEVSTREAVRKTGAGNAVMGIEEMKPADFWLIGTHDSQIADIVQSIAGVHPDLNGSLVFHLAGRFGLGVLKPLEECALTLWGCKVDKCTLHQPVRPTRCAYSFD